VGPPPPPRRPARLFGRRGRRAGAGGLKAYNQEVETEKQEGARLAAMRRALLAQGLLDGLDGIGGEDEG
jgi:hypothetical protein